MKGWRIVLLGGAIWLGSQPVFARNFLQEIEGQYNQGKIADALNIARAFVAAHPDSVDAHGFLGMLYAESGQIDAAVGQYRKLIDRWPGTVRGYRDLAVIYVQQGKHRDALQILGEGIQKSNEPALLLMERSELHSDMGNAQQAVADLETAIAGAPDFIDAYQNLALLHIALGDSMRAAGVMDRGLRANPNDVRLLVNRGGVFHALGQMQRALASYRQAVSVAPNDPAAYRAMGFMAAEIDSLGVARRSWEKARDLDPGDLEVRNALSQLYIAQDQADLAIAEMQEILRRVPDSHPVRLRLAETYVKKGEPARAKAEYQACIRGAAQWALPYKRLALLYMSEDKLDSAEVIYNQALRINQDDAEIHNNMGFIHSLRGDLKKARASYEKAIATSPDAATLRDAQNNLEIIASIQAGKLRARHIVVRTEMEAQAILEKLKTGADFQDMARQHSIDASRATGGNIGFFSKGDLHPDFEAAVLKLRPNDISGIVKTPMGYHLIQRIN